MKIKICGMREDENICNVSSMSVDYMGFIFYEPSLRYVGSDFSIPSDMSKGVRRTGVFVNSEIAEVRDKISVHQLDAVQLHGDETSEYCRLLHTDDCAIIKAFAIDERFEFSQLEEFFPVCDYFLFDTKAALYGGNGTCFNWEVLKSYKFRKPFFLSGGLGLDNIENILNFQHPMLYGFDFNSRLEDKAGIKNIEITRSVIEKIKNYENI